VQRYGSKGTVEMSLASRIALGNTGETCSPAAIFLTDNGKKHIDDSKRHHNKVIKKRVRRRVKKVDQTGGGNAVMNVERSLVQGVRFITSENNAGVENNGWINPHVRRPLSKKAATKRRDVTKPSSSTTPDEQMQKLQVRILEFFNCLHFVYIH
jgi:hypothetical protein